MQRTEMGALDTISGPAVRIQLYRAMKATDTMALSSAPPRSSAAARGTNDVIERYRTRLARFIRRRVPDRFDAEDILQEVFYEFVETGEPDYSIEQIGAWLFRVARNRITDLFRKKKPVLFADLETVQSDDGNFSFEDLLPSPEAGPDAVFARGILMRELADAIDELPKEQRQVFIAHEIEGRSFKEMAAETGEGVSTLLSRKHYAVLHLRKRLEEIHREFAES
jgi:RNA polymerase sigma factor (sigma-70 family)